MQIRDITHQFCHAKERSQQWSVQALVSTLGEIAAIFPGSEVDIEDVQDSGKHWGAVILPGGDELVVGWTEGPLVIVREDIMPSIAHVLEAHGVVAIPESDPTSRQFRLDASMLGDLFADMEWPFDDVDPNQMSISELIWATI